MQRNPIYDALNSQLQALKTTAFGVKVVERGFVPWDQADIQPAVYLTPMTEDAKETLGQPTIWTLMTDIYVYVRWVDSVAQGISALATIMDGVDYILSPLGPNSDRGTRPNVNTLGGLVTYCALSGSGQISGGFLNKNQTVARMPVKIMVPG